VDSVTLIHRARDAGLRLEVAGNALKITGPKEAEPLVRLLAEHKTQVMQVLAESSVRELRELREIAPEGPPKDSLRRVEDASREPFEGRCEFSELHKDAHQTVTAGIDERARAEEGSRPYGPVLSSLRDTCPAYVPEDRWRQAVADATSFVSGWGRQAQALGWTRRSLFGLHTPPERPAATYSRLSRYDEMGLIWLLRGRPVIAMTEATAAIQGATAILTYRKLNKPAYGPLGDSLDDMGAAT
jgi:hypothetical protein